MFNVSKQDVLKAGEVEAGAGAKETGKESGLSC